MSERDDDLVAELRALDAWLSVPEPADQRAAVRSRLASPAPRRRRWRLVVAAGVAAVAGTIGAVAPARAAVVDGLDGLLRIAGIEIRHEAAPHALPTAPSPLPSLQAAGLAEAERAARFDVRVPTALGPPEQVLTADPDDTGAPRVVTLVYRGGTVRLDQFDGAAWTFLKTTAQGEGVQVGADGWGVWLPAPHAVTYLGRDGVERTATARLATATLIWVDGEVTYRLEGLGSLAEAKSIAGSLD
ncbi:hypothetical protein ACWKSP_15485 [Micromonosporaceae bacterium Da 78-11]